MNFKRTDGRDQDFVENFRLVALLIEWAKDLERR